MRALVLAAGLALAACSPSGDEDAPAEATKPSLFTAEIEPLLASTCATCHLTGTEAGNIMLVPGKAIEQLVDVPSTEVPGLMRVKPGDPDNSYMVMKLEGTHLDHGGTGAQMPFGAPPLPPEKIKLIRQWIAEGAKP